jgi:alkylated DNA repair protein alkB family protein 1
VCVFFSLRKALHCLCNAGFYFVPEALSIEEQCQLIRESLTTFPQPPNRTNHNAFYGPLHDLFVAAKEKKVLVEEAIVLTSSESECNPSTSNGDVHKWKFCEEHEVSSRGNTCKSISSSALLRKLRWSTLGLQFDWSKVCAYPFFLFGFLCFTLCSSTLL